MRREFMAALLTGLLFAAGPFGETGAAQGQEPGKDAKPEPAKDQATAEVVKPLAACGFCLEDGTKVPLILGRELSSGTEATGNRVDFEVSEDIKVNDVLVIAKGSPAYGTIVEAQSRRRLGRAGKLNVRIEEVRLADGSRAKLRATQASQGKGRQGMMTGAMIATGILFFPAAPLFLFMRGKDVVIAKGTPVVSYVDGNTELEKAKFAGNGDSGGNSSGAPQGTGTNTPQR